MSLLTEAWYNVNFGIAWGVYTFGFSLKTVGSENMPKSGPVLLIANHESFLDPVMVGLAARRRIHYLARKTLYKNPLMSKYLHSVGSVPVDQVGVAKEGLKTSIELLNAGKPLLIFPEGERTWTGKMQDFKPGLLLILKKAPVPILPVGIAGAFKMWPRTVKLPKFSPLFCPGKPGGLGCVIGKPIAPEEYANKGREELLSFLFHAVRAEAVKAERLLRK